MKYSTRGNARPQGRAFFVAQQRHKVPELAAGTRPDPGHLFQGGQVLPPTESNGITGFCGPPTPKPRKTVVTCNRNLYMFAGS